MLDAGYGLTTLECSAAATMALSVWLAARRKIGTWPTGIVSCALYGALFTETRLYADATLQLFFIVTSVLGWRNWRCTALTSRHPPPRPLTPRALLGLLMAGISVTLIYGSLLLRWTDAYAPFWDSSVLVLSVIAQLLLMRGRHEAWPAWICVNTLSVPLYLSRELHVTAGLYFLFWINAWYGWWNWHRLDRMHHRIGIMKHGRSSA